MASENPDCASRPLEKFFDEHTAVKYVRLHWVDYSGVLRARVVPKSRCRDIAKGNTTYSLAQNCMICPISTAPRCFPGEPECWELVPDWTSIRVCGFSPEHAAVLCYIDHREMKGRFSKCPRTLLRKTLQSFSESCKANLLIGFEIEFVLLDQDSQVYHPVDRISACSTMAGLRDTNLAIMEEIVNSMEVSGIEFYHFHAEEVDQLEIAIAPLPPMEAIDAVMYTQETMRTVAIRHGLKATTAPRPVLNGITNGCHMHLSLDRPELAHRFLFGILEKLKALCAFGMANYDSYVRLGPDMAGIWIGYGTENRDLPIRKMSNTRWEIRIIDVTANLYLFLSALLEAGHRGVSGEDNKKWKDCGVSTVRLEPGKLADYGIVDRLPDTLRAALEVARADGDIKEWLGEDLLKAYFKVKDKEVESFSGMVDEQRRQQYLVFF